MNLGEKIAKSKENHDRRPQDFYATPAEVTQALLEYFAFPKRMKIREPCCGTGEMAVVLEHYGHEVHASDIEDRGYGVAGVDYIAESELDEEHYDFDAVITNPPFSNAEAIIRRALRDAPIVAMLLPSGYWHSARRAKLFEARRPHAILNLLWRPVFAEERGASPLMNVQWTVWMDNAEDSCRLTMFDVLHRPAATVPMTTPLQRLEKALAANATFRHGDGLDELF